MHAVICVDIYIYILLDTAKAWLYIVTLSQLGHARRGLCVRVGYLVKSCDVFLSVMIGRMLYTILHYYSFEYMCNFLRDCFVICKFSCCL